MRQAKRLHVIIITLVFVLIVQLAATFGLVVAVVVRTTPSFLPGARHLKRM